MIVKLPEARRRVTLPQVVTAATVLTFVQDFRLKTSGAVINDAILVDCVFRGVRASEVVEASRSISFPYRQD